jgi:hypothetical protein
MRLCVECGVNPVLLAGDECADCSKPVHEFLYRAGSAGLGHLGIADASPHWSCACGGWTMAALRVLRAPTGNNRRHAQRAWSGHVTAATRQAVTSR